MPDDRAEPLPSWRDGPVKTSILEFVRAVATEGGPDFVAPVERVAVFDNDGTLWAEQPMPFQVYFAHAWLAELAERDPGLRERQPYKAFLDHDVRTLSEYGIDFIRAFAAEAYGVPPEQVIGSSVQTRFEVRDGGTVLVKLAELRSFDDREARPQNIELHIGRRPILAVGNSDGDLAMLRDTRSEAGRRLALLVHHDDAEREFAYDREFRLSPLAEALDRAPEYGITVVSMRRDWRSVFPDAADGAAGPRSERATSMAASA